MLDNDIHVNDVGTRLEILMKDGNGDPADLSTYTTLGICLQKPDGTVITKVAQFGTDGTDGVLFVVSEAGDLDLAGGYRMQAFVHNTAGTWRSSIVKFKVKANVCG